MATSTTRTPAETDDISILTPEDSEHTVTEADDLSKAIEDILTLVTDPSVIELSFYNDCAHTEIIIFTRQKMHEFKLRLPYNVPVIDRIGFRGTLEEGYTHKTLETFYRPGACPVCRGLRGNETLVKLSARTHKERCILWQDFTSSFKLSWQYARQEELDIQAWKARCNLEVGKLMMEHFKYLSRPDFLAQVRSAKQKAKAQQQAILWQRKMYKLFNTFNNAQNQSSTIPVKSKFHLIAPGYDTKLLAPAADPTIENKDDNCSICFNKLYTQNGRVCSLPCGHTWHHGCIAEWLRTNHTCPMCRYR